MRATFNQLNAGYRPAPSGLRCAAACRRSFLLALLICLSGWTMAQSPTSLRYPTPNVFIAHVSTVYLAPTVAGNVSSYSITPALPAGLSFNTNTGVISGVPVAAKAQTAYTIRAKGGIPADSTSATVHMTVTSNYFNNNYDSLYFGGHASSIVNKYGDGSHAGDVVLYKNIATLSGQQIDCIVKTRAVTAGTTYSSVDQPLSTDGSTFNSNNVRFFSPQVTFPSGGGSLTYDFQFIMGNTYVDSSNPGMPVVLQNVRINTYDIDGNGGNSSNQFAQFGGFDTSYISSATTLRTPVYDPASGLTKYTSNISTNNQTVTADATRILVSYTNISKFSIILGAGASGAAYFFVDFSSGPAFATATSAPAPTIDLNTSAVGVNNASAGCGTMMPFTVPGQTNAASTTALSELRVAFSNTAGNIRDAANERLVINGGTPAANDTVALNFSAGSSTVSLGGMTYLITRTVSGNASQLSFTNNAGGTFTLAQAESLLDALHYYNASAAPSAGDRNFEVYLRNTQFESPSALFTATLNCVSISGYIYHDVNGLTNDSVDGSGTQFAAGQLYAVRVNTGTGRVIDARAIATGGYYSFGTVAGGTYALYFSTSAPAAGSLFSASVYPSGTTGAYRSTGEHLGAGAGNDLLADGKLLVTVGSVSVSNANFGLQLPPVSKDSSFSSIANPGGYNAYTLPDGSFRVSDEDGSISSITITAFPAGANYIKIGSTVYTTTGSICPPQSSCVPWPGTVTVPVSGGIPVQAISVDPALEGAANVVINFTARDNGGFSSNPGVITLPFAGTSYYTLSGSVWNDANGDGLLNGAETTVAPANAAQKLYAVLVQTTRTYSDVPTVLMSAAVNSTTGYSFSNVPAGNEYEVRIISADTVVPGTAAGAMTPNLANGWTGVATNNSGSITTGLNTSNPVNGITSLPGNRTAVNFGIERVPTADAKSFTAPNNSFTTSTGVMIGGHSTYYINANSASLSGSALRSLSGNDPEDCAAASSCSAGRTFVVRSVRTNTRLFYDFGAGNGGVKEVTAAGNSMIAAFDPARLTIYGEQGQGSSSANALGFTYSLRDNAGVMSAPAAYTLVSTSSPLPVGLVSFEGKVAGCNAVLGWKAGTETNMSYYTVEQSNDAAAFSPAATITALNREGAAYSARISDLAAGTYFRLKMVDAAGDAIYSKVLSLDAAGCADAALRIWPNPASDQVQISGLASGEHLLVLSDYTGRQVIRQAIPAQRAAADISRLAPGAYLLQVFRADGSLAQAVRLIKK